MELWVRVGWGELDWGGDGPPCKLEHRVLVHLTLVTCRAHHLVVGTLKLQFPTAHCRRTLHEEGLAGAGVGRSVVHEEVLCGVWWVA